jgi:hypothetical protein
MVMMAGTSAILIVVVGILVSARGLLVAVGFGDSVATILATSEDVLLGEVVKVGADENGDGMTGDSNGDVVG